MIDRKIENGSYLTPEGMVAARQIVHHHHTFAADRLVLYVFHPDFEYDVSLIFKNCEG